VSAICPIVRSSFADYASDVLPAPQRRILRDHLAACRECRDLAAAQEPAMLFARPFPQEDLPAVEKERIPIGRDGRRLRETERRIRRTSRRRFAGARPRRAAFGALLVMVAGGGARRVGRSLPRAGASGRDSPGHRGRPPCRRS
jgi:predicted anti-sigma-YlaC factor YlaD